MINLPKFQRKLVYFSCQVVHNRTPKLPGTGNALNKAFFSKKVVRPL